MTTPGVAGRLHRGFTLLEVLAVIFLTAVVIGVALDFYVDLSRAENRASGFTREIRRATAILDRVARDFESAVLVRKPAEVDPLAHPWLFIAEARYAETGADHLKFVTRNHDPRRVDRPESDLALVAYFVRRDDEDRLALLRWSSPRLPDGPDYDYPSPDDEGALLLADDIARFGVTLIAEDGSPASSWDSTTIVRSSKLPIAVDIEIAMWPADGADFDTLPTYRKRVHLPVRPLDLEDLFDSNRAAAGGVDDEDLLLGDCLKPEQEIEIDGNLFALYSSYEGASDQPWAKWKKDLLKINPDWVEPECR